MINSYVNWIVAFIFDALHEFALTKFISANVKLLKKKNDN